MYQLYQKHYGQDYYSISALEIQLLYTNLSYHIYLNTDNRRVEYSEFRCTLNTIYLWLFVWINSFFSFQPLPKSKKSRITKAESDSEHEEGGILAWKKLISLRDCSILFKDKIVIYIWGFLYYCLYVNVKNLYSESSPCISIELPFLPEKYFYTHYINDLYSV